MTVVWMTRLGALLGFLAVALGAFGAHALQERLDEKGRQIWNTAVQYHFWHALALFAAAFVASRGGKAAGAAAWCFLTGVVLFSGSLYALALTGIRGLGAITPLGGLLFLIGWLCLLFGRSGGGSLADRFNL